MRYACLVVLMLGVASYASAQTYPNIDDSLTNWTTCILPGCNPGGTGIPISTSQTINNAAPSLDGASMKVSVTAPVLSGGLTTNALWFFKPGANNSATQFVGTYHINIASTANVAALEYDEFQFIGGVEYMFGSQCVIGGFWQIWNQLTGTWVNTVVTCNLSTSVWHTIIWTVHRVVGDTACAGHACMYYDSLQVDSSTFTGFTPQPSGPTPFADNAGMQVQIDVNATGGTASEFLDTMSLTEEVAVQSNFWGVHYNKTNTVYPPVPPLIAKTVRLWDTQTGWADMLTARGQQGLDPCTHTVTTGCNFTKLHTWLNKFTTPSTKLVLTLAKTPNFISSNPTDANCGYTTQLGSPNGSCTPPTDMNCDGSGTNATWIQFLTALWDDLKANGYAGRITYLEIWNEWNVPTFWDITYIASTLCPLTTNAPEKMLVRFEQDARCVIRGTNCNAGGTYPVVGEEPAVLIMSSPLPSGGTNNAQISPGGVYDKYLSVGGGTYADFISIHAYVPAKNQTQPSCGAAPANANCMWPENVASMLTTLKTLMTTYNVQSLPIIVSEGSWGSNSNTTDSQFEQAFVPRYIALMASAGVVDFNWYNVDGGVTNPALFSNNATGALTTGGQAYQTVQQWLQGKTFSNVSCTVTAQPGCSGGASSNTYECGLTSGERMVWYDETADNASCTYSNTAGFGTYLTMSNTVVPIVGSINLDNRPILLEPSIGPSPPTNVIATPNITLTGSILNGGGNNSLFGPTQYLGTSTSTATLGTLTTQFGPTNLFNSTVFTPLNPTTDCLTRFIDQNVVIFGTSTSLATKFSTGNLTNSGGDNDVMSSVNTAYVGVKANGSGTYIFQTNTSGNCMQNATNGGENPSFNVNGPFSFSRVADNIFYYVTDNHILNQGVIVPSTPLTFTTTNNSFFPFDFDNCPGPVGPGAAQTGSVLGVAGGDTTFSLTPSWTGNQGTGRFAVAYRPGVGCSTLDLSPNGTSSTFANYYSWCSSNCSLAVPAGNENTCYDPNAATGQGTHDSQISLDGTVMIIAGGCFSFVAGNTLYWQINSNVAYGVGNGVSTWDGNVKHGGHTSDGYTHQLSTNNPNPNNRVISPLTTSNLSAVTTLQTLPGNATAGGGFHGSWPHPGGNDNTYWILMSAQCCSITNGVNNYLNPIAFQNEVFGMSPSDPAAPFRRFGSTFNSGTSPNFACGDGIGYVSQDGNWWFFLSDDEVGLGNDSNGNPLCSVFAYHLQ